MAAPRMTSTPSRADDLAPTDYAPEYDDDVESPVTIPPTSGSEDRKPPTAWLTALYISVFAVFGTVLRIYLTRFFGGDCEKSTDAYFESNVCATSSEGAVFLDLPANMLGSAVMGSLSHLRAPWLHRDHPLQRHQAWQTALRVGFCGCLTTFASWNTQMVAMLDGTTIERELVVEALYGYVIGSCCAFASFLFGQHVAQWLEAFQGDALQRLPRALEFMLGVNVTPFLLFVVLLAFAVVADLLSSNEFHRFLWMSITAAPFGALLRWKLSSLNSRVLWKPLEFMPWGTFTANVVASVISAMMAALRYRYLLDDEDVWARAAVSAIQTGFAGSLSTVSSLMNELFKLGTESPAKAYAYLLCTIVAAMLLGLLVYSPIVR